MAGFSDSWRHRSPLMKVFTLVQVLAIMLHSFCLVSKHWAVATGGDMGPRLVGLWDYIINRHKVSLGPSHVVGAVLAVASLVLMIGACVLNMLCLHRRLIIIMTSLIALTFTSGVLLVAVVVLWVTTHVGLNDLHLSWATYLAVGVAVLHLLTSSLAVTDLICTSRKGAPQYRVRQPPPETEEEVDELL